MINDTKLMDNISKSKRKYTKKKGEEKKKGKKRGRRKKGEEILIDPEETINYIIKHWPDIGVKNINDKALLGLRIQRDIKENYYVLDKFIYDGNTYYYNKKNMILDIYGQFVGVFIDHCNDRKKIYLFNMVYDNRTYDEVIHDIEYGIISENFVKKDNYVTIKPEAKRRGRKKGKRKKDDKFLMKPEDTINYLANCWPELKIETIINKVVSGIKLEKEKGIDHYVLDKFIHNDCVYWYDSRNSILDNNAKFVGFFIDKDGDRKIYFLHE